MADFPVTLAATRSSQLNDVTRINGWNTKFTILSSDIAVAGATGTTDTVTVTLGATPANWSVPYARAVVKTAFAGSGGLTVNVGTTSSTSAFITAQSVLTAGQLPMASTLPILTNARGTSSLNLVAIFTNSTSGSPSALTTGQIDIYLNVENANSFE